MGKQSTDDKNPAANYVADAEVAVPGKPGPEPSEAATDAANEKDRITGIPGGQWQPTKTSY